MGARIHLEEEISDEVDDREHSSSESFDRIAFAERVVALVRPREVTVAICEGRRRVRLTGGRQWGAPEGHRWAILSVPHDASRRAIANAVLELGALEKRPWVLDLLVRGAT